MKVATTTGDGNRPPPANAPGHDAAHSRGQLRQPGDDELHKRYPSGERSAAISGAQFLDALRSLPLLYQPGTQWDYSYGLEVAGLAVEAVTKKRLGDFLQERLFAPLGMVDTGSSSRSESARIARPLPTDPDTGQPHQLPRAGQAVAVRLRWRLRVRDRAWTTLRFAMMLLNKGTLAGTRILSRKTVKYMTANQLTSETDVCRLHEFAVEHIDGFGFGLGVAVRRQSGVAGVPGTPGEFLWSGATGRCSGSIRRKR